MGAKREKHEVARIDMEQCLAWKGEACDACYQACPGKDFGLIWEEWGPVILAPNCKGCDYCVQACKARNGKSFITMDSTYRHPSGMETGHLLVEWLSLRLKKDRKARRATPRI